MASEVQRLARLLTPFYASKVNAQLVHPARSIVIKPNELESALSRPIHASYYESEKLPVYYAAQLSYGIIMGHPFLDGNKRTAFFLANEYLRAQSLPGLVGDRTQALTMEEVCYLAEKFVGVAQGGIGVERFAESLAQFVFFRKT